MVSDLKRDREANFAILNYLRAGFQGQLAGENILGQTSFPGFKQEVVAGAQKLLQQIDFWIDAFFGGECFFTADKFALDTFDAQGMLSLLGKLKPDLLDCASEAARILTLSQAPSENDLKQLFSLWFRQLYARDTYLRGFLEFGKRFSIPELASQYDNSSEQASAEISFAQDLLKSFKEINMLIANLDEAYLAQLHQVTNHLPVTFRTQAHDVNQLIAQFKGGNTFANMDFSDDDGGRWKEAGFGAVQAGYWRAYNYQPEEAGLWLNAGFRDPGLASNWKVFGFEQATAAAWAQAGFAPDYAALWQTHGYDPERAMRSIEGGVKIPPEASTENAG